MDGTAIAIVSVCASAVAAVGAPAVAGLFEERRETGRFARDVERADLAELRQLLDETAVALETARLAVRRVSRLLSGRAVGDVRDGLEELNETGRYLMRLHARITIRLGTAHRIAQAAEEAHQGLREVQTLLEEWAQESGGTRFDWREEIELEARYVAARDEFITRAAALAGTRAFPE